MKIKALYRTLSIILLLFVADTLSAKILRVPEEYSKIQYGINQANHGDTVLVNEGTYYENLLIIGKEIVIASYYILDNDTNHINKTIINGSKPVNPDRGSVISFLPNYNSNLHPRVIGFTITGGTGTRLSYEIETTEGTKMVDRYVGGGIYIEYMSPIFTMNKIIGNKIINTETQNKRDGNIGENVGGGSYSFLGTPSFGGAIDGLIEINPGGNVFLDNYASVGKTFYAEFKDSTGVIHADNCFFDVYAVSSNDVSDYWAYTNGDFSFAQGQGRDTAIVRNTVFVSPNGSNDNNGLNPALPFRTLSYALSHIYPDSLNPITIILEPGIYSPSSNGELFPIQAINWATIEGASMDLTIIDAEANADLPTRVFLMRNVNGLALKNLTITGGYNHLWNAAGGGGGIYCAESNPTIENVRIVNNSAGLEGGGMYMERSNPILKNVEIINNEANKYGGGLYIGFNSNPTLDNVSIINNVSNYPNDGGGGGIYCTLGSRPVIRNSEIIDNTALHFGGGVYVENSNPVFENVIVKGNAADNGAGIYCIQTEGNFSELTVSENKSSIYGGGIYLFSLNDIHIENSKIFNNSALKGGGLFSLNARYTLDRVTFASNIASAGGGIYLELNSQTTIVNSILWDNTPNELRADDSKFRNIITVAYNNIKGGQDGLVLDDTDILNWLDGNIDSDPMFVDPENGDFSLNEQSPSVDAGVAYYMHKGKVLVDYSEESYKGNAPDMGALEAKTETGFETMTTNTEGCLVFPNPFRTKVSFGVNIIEGGDIKLSIYDLRGQEIALLANRHIDQGKYTIDWNINGTSIPKGTYIYVLRTKSNVYTGKIIYMK